MGFLIDEKRLVFGVETAKTTYAFAVDNLGLLRHLYWGPKLNGVINLSYLLRMHMLDRKSTHLNYHQ